MLVVGGLLVSSPAAPQYGSDTCGPGYVWREAFPNDHVCVAPATRERAAADNRQAASRREQGGGASGPDTCRAGFVWREASPTDHVCVTPDVRTAAAYDNAQSASRRGSDICRPGYVWREAFDGDHVCVPPGTRAKAREDNDHAAEHRQPGGGPSGPDTCAAGYVWREARSDDHVCVPPATRADTARENSAAFWRRLNPDCDTYAKTAIQQNGANRSQNCGFGTRDNRWSDNYDDHYDWCLHVDQTLRNGQTTYRAEALDECSRRTGTPNLGTATLQLELSFTTSSSHTLVVSGSGFQSGEQVSIHVQTIVDGTNGASFDERPTADSLGRVHQEFSVNCVTGRATIFRGSARGASTGRAATAGASC